MYWINGILFWLRLTCSTDFSCISPPSWGTISDTSQFQLFLKLLKRYIICFLITYYEWFIARATQYRLLNIWRALRGSLVVVGHHRKRHGWNFNFIFWSKFNGGGEGNNHVTSPLTTVFLVTESQVPIMVHKGRLLIVLLCINQDFGGCNYSNVGVSDSVLSLALFFKSC